MDKLEAVLLLKADYVFGSDRIGLPHRLIKVLAVDASEFGSEIVYDIEFLPVENPLDLTVLADVAAEIASAVQPVVMGPVQHPDLVALFAQQCHQRPVDGAQAARRENLLCKSRDYIEVS